MPRVFAENGTESTDLERLSAEEHLEWVASGDLMQDVSTFSEVVHWPSRGSKGSDPRQVSAPGERSAFWSLEVPFRWPKVDAFWMKRRSTGMQF